MGACPVAPKKCGTGVECAYLFFSKGLYEVAKADTGKIWDTCVAS